MKNIKSEQVNVNKQSNLLKAIVLGANDGIISIAGLVIGVAGATSSKIEILTAGLAGIVAGALSIAAGEYISVSAQRDIEDSLLNKERHDLISHPAEEMQDLVDVYEKDGLKPVIAKEVAKEFTDANAFAIHADVDLHIDPKNLTRPWSSVFSSALAFTIGASVPMFFIMLPVGNLMLPITFASVVIALTVTGIASAKISGANVIKSTIRVVLVGVIAMVITYFIGTLFKTIGA